MREFFEALDAADPAAVFWALLIWLAVITFGLVLVRVGVSAEGQGRRPTHRARSQDRLTTISRDNNSPRGRS